MAAARTMATFSLCGDSIVAICEVCLALISEVSAKRHARRAQK